MSIDRRYFIKSFGMTLGSLIVSGSLSGCDVKTEEKASTAQGTPITKLPNVEEVNSPSPKKLLHTDSELEPLRQCWLDLNNLQQTVREALGKAMQEGDYSFVETEEDVKKERSTKHRDILDALVGAGKLDKLVAEQIQVAFDEAQYHIARSMATCYIIIPYELNVRSDLLKQAEVLGEISGDLDPEVVTQARAAIAQDMAYFETIANDNDNYKSIRVNYEAGKLKASPEALEAARLLTELFIPETSD